MTQEQLQHILLPIGDTTKDEIRREAGLASLPTAQKKDSQGVCFLGHIDVRDFLSHFIELQEGAVLDLSGEQIGVHHGALIYTLGQRHGFTLHTSDTTREALYVVDRDIEKNTITVAPEKPFLATSDTIRLHDTLLTTEDMQNLTAQLRYRQEPFAVTLEKRGDGYAVAPNTPTDTPASGQSCVLYKGDWCVGGGIIA